MAAASRRRPPWRASERPRARTSCAPCASRAATPAMPRARCWSSSATRKVLCTASVEEKRAAASCKGKGSGWVTAEYGMLPRSTNTRTDREAARGKQSGRTQEIQRLIGRACARWSTSPRSASAPIQIDCDVLQADGGTRTAAHHRRLRRAARRGRAGCVAQRPDRRDRRCATSSPRSRSASIDGVPVLDLDYAEDSACDTDMNVVMTGGGGFVEVQGTAEGDAVHAAPRWTRCSTSPAAGIARAGRRSSGRRWGSDARPGLSVKRIVLAPATPASCASSRDLLAPLGIEVVPQGALGVPEAEEPHVTFVENALAKARHASRAHRPAGAGRRFRHLRRGARRRARRAFRALSPGEPTVASATAQQREARRRARGQRRPARRTTTA